jgi:hypothetical protein
MVTIRDRVKELRRVRAGDLLPDGRNPRRHPQAQREAMSAALRELARETPEGLVLCDGHLRAELHPDAIVPVLVLDIDEHEAALLLATLDPLAAMALTDDAALDALLRDVQTGEAALQGMLADLAEDAVGSRQKSESDAVLGRKAQGGGELEISAELFERHDYLVFYFTNEFDWNVAAERFGVKRVLSAKVGGGTLRHSGLGRVIPGERLLAALGALP